MADNEAHWYVAHTYSGYENKVKMDIEKTIKNRNLQDQIFEVSVPMLNVVEEKNDEKKTVQKKMFPAYVLINMIMNDDTWRYGLCGAGIQAGAPLGRGDGKHGP